MEKSTNRVQKETSVGVAFPDAKLRWIVASHGQLTSLLQRETETENKKLLNDCRKECEMKWRGYGVIERVPRKEATNCGKGQRGVVSQSRHVHPERGS